ncbi:MAG TPA: hypothetical protein VMY18_00085 [Acidobacteriota bacterium]|nr:hypothetical protein [Acidobacteriota bacterium]
MRSAFLVFIAVLVALFALSPVSGLSIREANLSEMVASADRVFYGQCLSAETGTEPSTGLQVRFYRFRVLDGLKGVGPGETLIVRQVAGAAGGPLSVPGMVQYQKGQRVLLFLHKDSRLGLTSPVGMNQGLFRAKRRGDGGLGFVNAVNNKNLTHNLSASAASEMGVDPDEMQRLRSGEPLRLNVLRELVSKIDRYQREKGYSIR